MMQQIVPKKSARISPDRPGVGILSIALVLLVMLASMVFSFEALRDAAEWTGAPHWAQYLAPIYIDGSILAYTVALAVFRWRLERKHAASALAWLRSYTAASMVINGLHAASFHGWDVASLEMWGGIAIAAGAPLSALVSAEQVIRLVFQQDPNEVSEASFDREPQVASEPAPVEAPEAEEPVASVDFDNTDATLSDGEPEPQPVMLPVGSDGLFKLP